ncbi:MAG: energy transducer TonB [Saprospiraceae bacterium]
MKKEKKHRNFIPQPDYPGGPKGITEFIYKELKYPEDAVPHKVEGTVVLKAEINYKGDVIDAKIISSLFPSCDEEAIRVVKLLKFKIEKIRDLKVRFYKTFNIKFKMSIKNTEMIVNYIVLKSEPKKQKLESPKIIINYKINE